MTDAVIADHELDAAAEVTDCGGHALDAGLLGVRGFLSTPEVDRLGPVTAATRRKCEAILDAVQAEWGIRPATVWGWGPNPEHNNARCLDVMVTTQTNESGWLGGSRAMASLIGDFVAELVWDRRVEWGLRHVLWRQRILSAVVSPGIWRPMADRGSITQNHYDHPHINFASDAFATHTLPDPAPAPVPTPAPIPAPTSPTTTTGGFLMALTDQQQEQLYYRVMCGIPGGDAQGRYNPDGSAARILDSADGDYLRVTIEAQTAAIRALATDRGADPDRVEAVVRDAVTAALADLRIVGGGR